MGIRTQIIKFVFFSILLLSFPLSTIWFKWQHVFGFFFGVPPKTRNFNSWYTNVKHLQHYVNTMWTLNSMNDSCDESILRRTARIEICSRIEAILYKWFWFLIGVLFTSWWFIEERFLTAKSIVLHVSWDVHSQTTKILAQRYIYMLIYVNVHDFLFVCAKWEGLSRAIFHGNYEWKVKRNVQGSEKWFKLALRILIK